MAANRGTTSWTYENGDGTGAGFESDSIHPLEAKEFMLPLSINPTATSSNDPLVAYLRWDIMPDKVTVHCWSEECWGQFDAKSEDVPVEVLKIDFADGSYDTNFCIELKDENYIYEIIAEWNSAQNYGGTVYYSFYTEM